MYVLPISTPSQADGQHFVTPASETLKGNDVLRLRKSSPGRKERWCLLKSWNTAGKGKEIYKSSEQCPHILCDSNLRRWQDFRGEWLHGVYKKPGSQTPRFQGHKNSSLHPSIAQKSRAPDLKWQCKLD